MLKVGVVTDAVLVGVALALAFVFVQTFAPSAFAVDSCTSKRFYADNLPWQLSGTINTVIDVATGIGHTPAAIGHLGEGSGTFSADPSWRNLPGVVSDVLVVASVLSATASALPSLNGSAAAAAKSTAYRAVNPKYAHSTLDNGFYRSGAAGRLGNDGIYANSSVKGAVAEFQYHNPGVKPTVFEVSYPSGSSLKISPPSGNFYIESPLPFTQGANVLSAPSFRAPGTVNYLIREGAVPGRIVP